MSLFKEGMGDVTEESMKASESNIIPAGDYNIQCVKMEMKENETSGKKSISMQLKILGPTQTGRMMFQNLYCFSDNEKHNKRQFDFLGVFAKRAGTESDDIPEMDLSDFEGLQCGAKIRISIDKTGKYDDKNEVSHFKKWINEIANDAAFEENKEKIPF